MKEEELIKKAQTRDPEAFGLLYDQYLPAIYRFILLKIGDKVTTEDLAHQVFLSAWQNIEKYKIQGFPFSSWLYRIAHNAVIDYYRTDKKNLNLESIAETAAVNNLEEKIDQEFELNIIKAALKELPEEQQSIIIMRFVEDMTNEEIAVALGKNEGAIRTAQHRSLENIRKIVNEKYNRKIKEV